MQALFLSHSLLIQVDQMVLQCWSYVGIVKMLKANDIVFFFLSVFEMGLHEELWTCIYKRVEVKKVNGNAMIFLCERGKVLKY